MCEACENTDDLPECEGCGCCQDCCNCAETDCDCDACLGRRDISPPPPIMDSA